MNFCSRMSLFYKILQPKFIFHGGRHEFYDETEADDKRHRISKERLLKDFIIF